MYLVVMDSILSKGIKSGTNMALKLEKEIMKIIASGNKRLFIFNKSFFLKK